MNTIRTVYALLLCFLGIATLRGASDGNTVVTTDGVTIAVKTIVRPHAQKIVVFCHGLGDNKDSIAHILTSKGLFADANLYIFDFRGHGKSTGRSTRGIHEWRDIQAVMRHVHKINRHTKFPVYGIGISMGGAALMKAVAHGSRFNKIVVDSAYADLYTVAKEAVNLKYVPKMVCNWFCGGDTCSVNIAHYGNKIKIPVLILHSNTDTLIQMHHAHTIRDAISTSELVVITGVPHAGILTMTDVYSMTIASFLSQ